MSALNKIRKWLLGKPATGAYKGVSYTRFNRHRDLPPFTFKTITEMLLDPTIRLGLAMRAAPLSQAEFAIKKGEQWEEGVKADRPEVGRFVHAQIKRIWKFELHKILSAQVWGWSAGEVTYRLIDNQVHVDGILHRLAHDVFALHEDGEVKAVRFKRVGRVGDVDVRFPRSFWHAFDPEAESPYGWSVLRGAHSPWVDKASDGGALDTRRLFMFKDAYGGTDITYPPGVIDIEGKGVVPARDIARELGEQLTAGGTTARPAQYDENGKPLWELTRATVPSNPSHILDYPKDLDIEMLRGLEIPDDVLTSEGSGAWQGKQVPMMAFYVNADRWLAQVVRVVVTQILEPLVLLNWGRAEEFQVTTKPLAEQAMEQMKSSGNDSQQQQPGQQPGQQQPQNGQRPAFGRQQMALDDGTTAEMLVGRGEVQAAHLVEAGRRYMLANQRPVAPPKKRRPRKLFDKRLQDVGYVSQSLSLLPDERQLLERLTNGKP